MAPKNLKCDSFARHIRCNLIVDAHVHLHHPHVPAERQTAEYIVSVMLKYHVDMSVISPLDVLAGKDFRAGNDAVSEAARKYPDKLVGCPFIAPYFQNEAADEVERALRNLKLKGYLKLHPTTGFYFPDSPVVYPIMDKARKFKVPVFFHTGQMGLAFGRPMQFVGLAERYPDVKIIIGHIGHYLSADAVILAKKHENVLLESSYAWASTVMKAIQSVGAERVLFGSDSPIGDPGTNISGIEGLEISEDERRMVLGENIVRILNLKRGLIQ